MSLLFCIGLGVLVLLNLVNLPANWLIVGLIGLWHYFHLDSSTMDLLFWVLILGTAVLGEVLEWLLLAAKAKGSGASSAGTFAGMIGAFAGALLCAPFFFGLGAFIGALAGAYAGCLLMELLKGRPMEEALLAAKGTLWGRFLGSVCKCAAGATIVVLAHRHILASAETVASLVRHAS